MIHLIQVLKLSQSTIGELSIGRIVNLASNDVKRFDLVKQLSFIAIAILYYSYSILSYRVLSLFMSYGLFLCFFQYSPMSYGEIWDQVV